METLSGQTVHEHPLRTAVVTGASRGVGWQLVQQLSERGVRVWALARKLKDIERLNTLTHVTAVQQDLTDMATLATHIAQVLQDADVQQLDLLAHVGAAAAVGPAAATQPDVWQTVLQTNVVAPAVLTGSLISYLRAAQGTVVFINSGAGERAVAQHAVYAASKHALRGYANTLRLEESQYGVRVSTVYPGQIATDMLRTIDEQLGVTFDAEASIQPQTVARAIVTVATASDDVHITNLDLRPRQEFTASFHVG